MNFNINIFAIFATLNLLFSAQPSFSQSIAFEVEYRSACEAAAAATNGAVYFATQVCKCRYTSRPIDPFNEDSIFGCEASLRSERICKSAGSDITRWDSNNSSSRPSGNCFCMPLGRYVYGTEGVARCQSTHHRFRAPSSGDVGRTLSYYLSGLPHGAVPLVDTRSWESILKFLDPLNSSRTVKIVATIKGRHEGVIYIYRKKITEREWMDVSDPVGVQNDPRLTVEKLGPILGAFFGFRKIDDNTYTFPSVDEFKRAIEAINREEEIIAGRVLNVKGQFGNDEYITSFLNDGALPIPEFVDGEDQTYFFHDMGLHLSSFILFPKEIWNTFRRHIERVKRATELSIDELFFDAESAVKGTFKTSLIEELVAVVDFLSSIPPQNLAAMENFRALMTPMASAGDFEQLGPGQIEMLNTNAVLAIQLRNKIKEHLNRFGQDAELDSTHARIASSLSNASSIDQKLLFLFDEHKARLINRIYDLNQQCESAEP